ncbi:DUF1361 domain-containing protein [Chamaesiphon sp. GL140_3_metabinner_50]|uniref:DUF1361 domain-containing protein n=1 Tax=Chamaesiphon sp. GL140_3_metabinner_50 TaxID=2970812 RepID=UPI0025CC3A9D|nr:DUF1361 domain-containing protein [Chamaesiphon sp. GL140_3_metabinner_50]
MLLSQIPIAIDPVVRVIADDLGRIAWNSFLALVPLTLSFFLFNKPRSSIFCWSTYILLGISFVIGIKKYNNGNLLEALERIVMSLWGVRIFFIAISVGLIIILAIVDRRLRSNRDRSIFWWMGLFLFLAILPNAPYILTDIIHFYEAVRTLDSVWAITLIIVPIYIIFIGLGWFCYVCSLVNIDEYLHKYHLDRYTSTIELSLHLLCAIGIYIGRFIRFNSWSLVTQPKYFLSILPGELIGKFPVIVILLTFLIITILYAICKPIIVKSSLYSH